MLDTMAGTADSFIYQCLCFANRHILKPEKSLTYD